MKALHLFAAVMAMSVLAGCIGRGERRNTTATQSVPEVTVQRYSGTLPAANADGIRTDLTLTWDKSNGNTYELREEYIGRETFNSKGKFAVETGFNGDMNAEVIVLGKSVDTDEPRYYLRYPDKPEVLHTLSPERQMITSMHDYTLKLQ